VASFRRAGEADFVGIRVSPQIGVDLLDVQAMRRRVALGAAQLDSIAEGDSLLERLPTRDRLVDRRMELFEVATVLVQPSPDLRGRLGGRAVPRNEHPDLELIDPRERPLVAFEVVDDRRDLDVAQDVRRPEPRILRIVDGEHARGMTGGVLEPQFEVSDAQRHCVLERDCR
jgi:hypothetical protein